MDNLLKNQTVEGFSTIVQALTSSSNAKNLLGDDPLSRALTQQWLEYATVCANYADNSANTKRVLQVYFLLIKKKYPFVSIYLFIIFLQHKCLIH